MGEVFIAPELSGNIATDLKKIKTKETINFYDVGILGFKGKPEEKIMPISQVITPTSIQIEELYKYISGYYKKLKTRHKWEAENNAVARMLDYYIIPFFKTTHGIPENRVYDFLLFCAETSQIENDFRKGKYGTVLLIFEKKRKKISHLIEGDKE